MRMKGVHRIYKTGRHYCVETEKRLKEEGIKHVHEVIPFSQFNFPYWYSDMQPLELLRCNSSQ